MPRGRDFSLTDKATLGLFYIQRYRSLTIDQFARAVDLNRSTAGDQLRMLERHGIVGFFGNSGLAGHGKTPKVYFLTRKGYDLLTQEGDIPPELLGSYKDVHVQPRWSPQMFHRLRTVDLLISVEVAVRSRPNLNLVATFLEYRRTKRGENFVRETTDFVAEEETSENRIVPDAAFILENIETKKRRLFFLEMDMATERIVTRISRDDQLSLHHKFAKYDRYLKSRRYSQTYAAYGDLRSFILLFVTLNNERVENIRRELHDLPEEFSSYYRFATFEEAIGDL